jgi:putative ABC transport system permease protein
MDAPQLGYLDLALASALVLANAGLSWLLDLGLARQIVVATARAAVQLSLVGLVLKLLFAAVSLPLVLLAVAVMIGAASQEVATRQERWFRGWWGYGVGAGPMAVATLAVAGFALTTHIRSDPWYDPRFVIPLVGIILGNAMSGVSLALNSLLTGVSRDRAAIESRLALGVDRMTALGPFLQRAMRSGLIPVINQMAAAGLITLPGMLTGQVLAGMDPAEAVKYQILILFLLAGATGFGVLGAVQVAARRLTDERHRLRLDRLLPAAVPANGRPRRQAGAVPR